MPNAKTIFNQIQRMIVENYYASNIEPLLHELYQADTSSYNTNIQALAKHAERMQKRYRNSDFSDIIELLNTQY